MTDEKTTDAGEPGVAETMDAPYYCDWCGRRYQTLGTCEGILESPHRPHLVVSTAGENE